MNQQRSMGPIIACIVLALLLVGSLAFGLWAFSERSTYKNEADALIEDAVALAVQEAETAKEAEFVEREKSPVKTYTGPSTYGSIAFDYPKTWSVYEQVSDRGTVLEVLAHPKVIPGIDSELPYAMKIEVLSEPYDQVLEELQRLIEQGELRSSAFRAAKVNNVLGVRLDGTISQGKTGSIFLLPLRDRTIKISNEVPQNIGDLENIILPSLTFIP